jgi:hypothetical protein
MHKIKKLFEGQPMRDGSQFQCDKSAVRQREGFLWLLDKSPSSQDKTPYYTQLSPSLHLSSSSLSLSIFLFTQTDTQAKGERRDQKRIRQERTRSPSELWD